MKLVAAQVRYFRNIIDSNEVDIQPEVTCLVGKNESGKTAFLHSLYRLFPALENVSFSVPDQYPAWLEKKHRLQGKDLLKELPIFAKFRIDPDEIEKIEKQFGAGILKDNTLEMSKYYNNELNFEFNVNEKAAEKAAVDYFLPKIDILGSFESGFYSFEDFNSLREFVNDIASKGDDDPDQTTEAKKIKSEITEFLEKGGIKGELKSAIETLVPKFFYFSEFSCLPYSVNIEEVLKADPKKLDNHVHTARALLKLAASDDDYLLNPDYERRKRELENVANALTDEVLKYWSQNDQLRVSPDITTETSNGPVGKQVALDELKIRIWDNRHHLSLPFNEHSSGFQWFFSFLAAFSEYEFSDKPVIILLDEPALGLHAKAQSDFLRFIDERLAIKHQVIYSTHSPFMVQTENLDRVRLVIDEGTKHGSIITSEIFTTDKDTLFPLQGALGYDLVQNLFIAPHNLIVEGTSDFTYFSIISDHLAEQEGRTSLDERWAIVPAGSADLIPSFVSLLGTHLDITVVVDSQKGGHQRLSYLASKGYLADKRIITIGQVLDRQYADVEDLFSLEEYLYLYNTAFNENLKGKDIPGTDPVVKRISRLKNVKRFDHGKPADALLRNKVDFLNKISEESLKKFENLFKKINSTL